MRLLLSGVSLNNIFITEKPAIPLLWDLLSPQLSVMLILSGQQKLPLFFHRIIE